MAYTNIDLPTEYFDTKLYTGTGATNSITGLSFKPDLVWGKQRSGAEWHVLSDAVRGVPKNLYSNATDAEDTISYLTSLDTNGFTLSSSTGLNGNGSTYVAWNWLGANTTVSNTSGTITSTVSANTTSGFSIVSYTYTSGSVTVGHGLGVAPSMIIVKARSVSDNWRVYHKSLGNSAFIPFTTAAQTTGSTAWNSTSPTSSVFSLGSFWGGTDTHIAYCFAEIKGFSKAFSYTGNGSTDGTFVYTGFSPAWVMIKQSSTSGNGWIMMDNKRNTYNPNGNYLQANLSDAEETAGPTVTDFVSNGFKIRTASGRVNTSGATYIGIAFATNPFVSSKGIPTTAR
jgi:hypothetical protein